MEILHAREVRRPRSAVTNGKGVAYAVCDLFVCVLLCRAAVDRSADVRPVETDRVVICRASIGCRHCIAVPADDIAADICAAECDRITCSIAGTLRIAAVNSSADASALNQNTVAFDSGIASRAVNVAAHQIMNGLAVQEPQRIAAHDAGALRVTAVNRIKLTRGCIRDIHMNHVAHSAALRTAGIAAVRL